MTSYPHGRIGTISELHAKVIHGPQIIEVFTDKEYYREDRWISKLNNAALNLVCSSCFPLMEPRPKYPSRSAEKYDIRYPAIHKIVG